ncbi:MAG: VWA domain-containing protein [Mollicutes bacterium]|nr:VWA domain-containing protein [Mollicutes bacterium]
MKKLFKLSLLFCLFFPLIAFASVKVSFDDAKWSSNTYITQFSNYRWYIDFNTKKKYAYNGSTFSEVSGFDRGGLVNLNEYKISLEDGKSYLRTARPYWTMTLNGSKIYSINDGTATLLDRTSIASGVRPTEYIIHQTEVAGQGSFRNPWIFVKPEFYVDVEYNSPQIKRNGTGVKDTAVEYGDIVTYSIGLKNNGVKDSVINIREVALISAIDKLVKLKIDTSADVKLTIGDKTMSLSEAKAAANAVLSDNGYTVTIAPGKEMTLEFNVVIIGNAGQVINNQLLYVMDGLEADPGTKNSMYIEKVVQYNEIAENGANVVLALDNSGSMGSTYSKTSKISKLKDANQKFLDIMLGENSNDNNEVCVVIMPKNVSVSVSNINFKCSKSYTELLDFSNNYLTASGLTPFTNTFKKTYDLLMELKNKNKLNTNFAMFLSDGSPVGDNKTNFVSQANNIKSVGEFFTVGFQTNTTATNLLKELATDSEHYFDAKTTDIEDVFKNIAKKINEKSKRTTKGVLAISRNIDKTKNLIIEVTSNGTTTEIIKTYTEALNENYIINKGSRYEINIKKFNAADKISVTYFLEKN